MLVALTVVRKGARGGLGDRAVRQFSADETTLHRGLLDVRDQRFAHAGPDANHRCILALFEHGGAPQLVPGFEIETPTGMFDHEQVALMGDMVHKLRVFADEERVTARQALENQIADQAISGPILDRLRTTRRHATPEAQVIALLARRLNDSD
jgi:hypothetical protein